MALYLENKKKRARMLYSIPHSLMHFLQPRGLMQFLAFLWLESKGADRPSWALAGHQWSLCSFVVLAWICSPVGGYSILAFDELGRAFTDLGVESVFGQAKSYCIE